MSVLYWQTVLVGILGNAQGRTCVTATVWVRFSTACHHPSGTYMISPAFCTTSRGGGFFCTERHSNVFVFGYIFWNHVTDSPSRPIPLGFKSDFTRPDNSVGGNSAHRFYRSPARSKRTSRADRRVLRLGTKSGQRLVYRDVWTNSHQLRDKTLCMDFGNAQYVPEDPDRGGPMTTQRYGGRRFSPAAPNKSSLK